MNKKFTFLSAQIPVEIKQQLQELAIKEDRSLSKQLTAVLRLGLEALSRK